MRPEKSAETLEFADMEDEDEIIDLGDDEEQVLAELKQSLEDRQDTSGHEVNHSALQNDLKCDDQSWEKQRKQSSLSDCRPLHQHTGNRGGYDYSIMGADYKGDRRRRLLTILMSVSRSLNDIVGGFERKSL